MIYRRLNGLAGPDYDDTISFGLPIEPEDCQYGESRSRSFDRAGHVRQVAAAANRTLINWIAHTIEDAGA